MGIFCSKHCSQAPGLLFKILRGAQMQFPSLQIFSLSLLAVTFLITLLRNWQFIWQSSRSKESVWSSTSRFVNVLGMSSSSVSCHATGSAWAAISRLTCGLLCVEAASRKTIMALKTAPWEKPVKDERWKIRKCSRNINGLKKIEIWFEMLDVHMVMQRNNSFV